MQIRIVSWNIRRANKKNTLLWNKIFSFNADILLLQEVTSFPKQIYDIYKIKARKAVTKNGNIQRFHTAVLVKHEIDAEIKLFSKLDWVNKELTFFNGNLVACRVNLNNKYFNIISVYSPAWPVKMSKIKQFDISQVKLENNPDVWCTEILWDALKNVMPLNKLPWIVGGDFNSSPTFDMTFGSGNQEIIDRMYSLGFKECLKEYNGKLTPTFKNPKGGKIIHQIDHLYTSNDIFKNLKYCNVIDQQEIFQKSLSDHLPIVANFQF